MHHRQSPTRSSQDDPTDQRAARSDGRSMSAPAAAAGSMALPAAQGLYDPRFEHDACGLTFLVDLAGRRSRDIVARGITGLCNLEHRGAKGADANSGDGAGLLLQVPDRFLRAVAGFDLPPAGQYAVGIAFLPRARDIADRVARAAEAIVAREGLRLLGWRDVPTDDTGVGASARATQPSFRMLFVTRDGLEGLALDRYAYVARRAMEHELGRVDAGGGIYFPSLSSRTLVYKGMLTTPQLASFFPDLHDERMESALVLLHSRFSTNTFPTWPLAHPFRFVAHNGEINTVQGNRNWMRSREALLSSPHLPGDITSLFPICTPGNSDSATFDEVLELLHLGGYSLPHAMLMMIPEAWEHHDAMPDDVRAFYRYHASLMEPWDGPASMAFTDGTVIGAVLDRNGLRPSRYWVTDEGLVVLASEVGVLDIAPERIVHKGRLRPGRMLLVDTAQGRIVDDAEIKRALAAEKPYQAWLDEHLVDLGSLTRKRHTTRAHSTVLQRQQVFGYTSEELRLIIEPMARTGAEPIGSMGTDTPLAVLSLRPRLLFDYFAQLFAQVTNPPLDAIREELVTSMGSTVGPEENLLAPTPRACRQIHLPHPTLDNDALATLEGIHEQLPDFRAVTIPCVYPVKEGGPALRAALDDVCRQVSVAIAGGANVIILSDRPSTATLAPIPSLLFTGAVHHHLLREKTRTQIGLVVVAGDAREVHHMCLLLGYGVAAINPYLAFETIEDMIAEGMTTMTDTGAAIANYIKACDKGVLKVMSKMGISTVSSYTGAQIFEAVGLSRKVVDAYFTGTVSRIGGIGLDEIAEDVARRHADAYPARPTSRAHRALADGGEYQWRREGEHHLFNPETVYTLQHATRTKRYDLFKAYTRAVDDQAAHPTTLRSLLRIKVAGGGPGARQPIPIDEVEPVSSIVGRFSTGAMSYGSISAEAHEVLAIAMNRLGARSNTGEGGEDPERNIPLPNGDSRRSAIKQVASGRFGVTSEYLVNATDLQIKMAQGAKPGEGGQLPGHKVYPWIAKTRHSTPGVGLISPPPHHDIYSIEDLAQLIFDLRNANPEARIHVKLVAEVGVGTVAAGVAKAHADVVLISGHDGGTGASPLTSLKHAGVPWELGLAEAQQTLRLNGLRDRVVVQVDGQLKTGRDVIVAALLGAEEYGFATAPLVVTGCVMMRVCHLDTCPVGVATQNPDLRARFTGKAEHVVNFFEFIAQDVREWLAAIGARRLDEVIGRSDLLELDPGVAHWKTRGLDLAPLLHDPVPADRPRRHLRAQDHGLDTALDRELIATCADAVRNGTPVSATLPIRNVHRTVGTMLGSMVTRRHGGAGLPDDTIVLNFTGSAGQSFGAFLPRGITLRLEGDANDHVGKGLSGGRIIVRPPRGATFVAEHQIIAGNVLLYGATGGELFARGIVGERFAVRNSGAIAVVEGVGDHGCEYMTGGRVVVLGPVGRNFAAGMSGGIAFVHDPGATVAARVNRDLVDLDGLDLHDAEFLSDIVARHLAETGSTIARRVLDGWEVEAQHFVRVLPRDYKRVLETERAATSAGRDPVEAVMAIARA